MARPRKYESNKERQAAYRERDKAEWVQVPRGDYNALMARLEALQRAVSDAAKNGNAVAVECRADGVETTIDNLTKYF